MSLGTALNIAQNSLLSVSRRTDVVARNVAGANDENYVRREAATVAGSARGATHVSRAALDAGLVRSALDARSRAAGQSALEEGLRLLSVERDGPDGAQAPLAALSRLHDALQTWSAAPADDLLAEATGSAAQDVAASLRRADRMLAARWSDTDERIEADVRRLNERLADFADANGAITGARRTGAEPPLDAFDRRDAALRDIGEIIPVSTLARPHGDLMLLSARAATLFETVPRTVSYDAAAPGVLIDGVPLSASGPDEPRGRLEAHLRLHETVRAARAELDALAGATADAFRSSGLFTATGSTGAGAGTGTGAAATIEVPAGYDMATLRDGPPGLADHIIAAAESLEAPRAVAASGVPTQAGSVPTQASSVLALAGDAVSRLDERVREAGGAAERLTRLHAVLDEKRVRKGGVDVDAEMTRLLALERSYEASARIIAVADRMLADLFAAVR